VISIANEKVIPLSRVGDYCPSSRVGKKLHSSTALRWAKAGCRADDGSRVTLETIRAGSTTYTSVEAIQRFLDRLSGPAPQPRPTPDVEKRRREQVERELAAYGL
jgi:hypothetical protein